LNNLKKFSQQQREGSKFGDTRDNIEQPLPKFKISEAKNIQVNADTM